MCAIPLLPRVVLKLVVPSLCHPNSLAGGWKPSVTSCRSPSVGSLIPHGLVEVSDDSSLIHGSHLLDVVGRISRVVDDGMYLAAVFGIDVGQEPVAHDISLDPPGKGELALVVYEVDKAGLRLADSSCGLLDGVRLCCVLWLGSCRLSRNWKCEDIDSGLQGGHRLGTITLGQTWRGGDFALVERVSEREDIAITANLTMVSNNDDDDS